MHFPTKFAKYKSVHSLRKISSLSSNFTNTSGPQFPIYKMGTLITPYVEVLILDAGKQVKQDVTLLGRSKIPYT